MTKYLISDLHLGHEAIIRHCDRPFADVDEMNETLIDNWTSVVDTDDIVVFLGDLGRFAEETSLRRWIDELSGRVIFVEGNHDSPDPYVGGLNTHRHYELSHGDRTFCCTHDPADVPRSWDGWTLHGHHHDDDAYPFVDPVSRRVNLSVEVIGYRPLRLDDLLGYLDRDEPLRRLTFDPDGDN